MSPGANRHLDWDGCFNARDLGGLPARDGKSIRRGAVVRSDGLDQLTRAGWEAVEAYGIRTIVDLRNQDERASALARPAGIRTLHLPLDNVEDTEFWSYWNSGWQCGTPLYYQPHIRRFPARSAAALAAIARAEPGGVLFHCVGGRDRTGQIAMLLLWLLGVEAEHIAADYELSQPRLKRLYARRGEEDQGPAIEQFMATRGTSVRAVIEETLASLELEWLLGGGLSTNDVEALRARLLEFQEQLA